MSRVTRCLFLIGIAGLAGAAGPRLVEGPRQMPFVDTAMLTAQYWIGRLPDPDREAFRPEDKQRLERQWREQDLLIDLNRLPAAVGRGTLKAWITQDFKYFSRVARYGERGQRLQRDDLRRWQANAGVDALPPSVSVGWGMTVRPTSMKLLPTARMATVNPLDLEFNVFNHSHLRLAEPLAVLAASADKEWWFVASEIGRGWVRAEDVAISGRETVLGYRRQPLKIVMAADVRFRQDDGRQTWEGAKMGTRVAVNPASQKLLLPHRSRQGRLTFLDAKADPADGLAGEPRPLTPRAIIEQAYRLLHAPYGWGGEGGFGDCSEFIHAVGLACGLTLPRSTADLRRALPSRPLRVDRQAKAELLSRLPPGLSLLDLPGHVMLLLGSDQGRFYVIHNFYGLHKRDARGDYVFKVGRVVVSELTLGSDSVRGSLFNRVERALFLSTPPEQNAE